MPFRFFIRSAYLFSLYRPSKTALGSSVTPTRQTGDEGQIAHKMTNFFERLIHSLIMTVTFLRFLEILVTAFGVSSAVLADLAVAEYFDRCLRHCLLDGGDIFHFVGDRGHVR